VGHAGGAVSRSEVRTFLDRHELWARKDLGQNFLVDDPWAARLVDLAGIASGDAVIEVGTGTGVLTRALAARAAQVVTLDIDAGLVRALRAEGTLPANVELLHTDVLRTDLAAIAQGLPGPVHLVSNLPYSISGPALRQLLDLRDVLVDWSVMLQREVAERLLASPGTKAYGSLSVLHALVVRVERLCELPPGCFFPEPQVQSSFLHFAPRADSPLGPGELRLVERVARAAFGNRRKTLWNAMRAGASGGDDALRAALAQCGIDPGVRGEKLTPEAFLELARALAETSGPGGG
jgi:16S rRNA (adenine1518-N6/adenine1519-N6)-dimethyltransferase